MNNWWGKIKEHPIYSKVAAGLIVAAILAICNFVFSWNIFSSNFITQKWIVPAWLFICIVVVFIIVLWMAIIFYFRKENSLASYPERVKVIREYTKPHQYIIKNNIVRHIPDPATFEYLGQLHGFDWGSSEGIAPDDFKKFSSGSALPSILPYCKAFCKQEINPEITYESPYYWKIKDGIKDGPFCQRCYDKDNSLMRLQSSEKGSWVCMECKSRYYDSSYDERGAFVVDDY